jgi:polyhydroxyalkanoate synthesis regulator phasin
MRLRPVTFRYKNDSTGMLQYGLVAEEVERVYPELVTRGTDGKLQSVRYLELTSLLLNELQKQASKTRELSERTQAQAAQLHDQAAQLRSKDAELAAQRRRIEALEQQQARFDALSERVAALERQSPTATGRPGTLGSLAQR